MTLVQYTAEVRDGLLLELPAEAEELHLKPGDKVTVKVARAAESVPQARSEERAEKPKQLRGRGMLAGILSTEEFLRRKHEETAREDRPAPVSIHVLDASAMVAYLTGEPGDAVVTALLSDPIAICYAHSVNLCEVYYDTLRATDTKRARQTIAVLFADGVIERQTMGRRFWQRVGDLKARGGISLADCFGIALAQHLGGEVVTSDHHEFDPLVPLGIVAIKFIR